MASHNEGILLSACLIVRNEQEFLEGCLRSIKDHVNEIIIVDTGSTDQTLEIAKRFSHDIFTFPWQDNFSDARNFCISKAKGQWILQIDADERIQPVCASYLQTLLKDPSFIAYRCIDAYLPHYSALNGHIRLFRNDKRIRYEGIIHESVNDSIEDFVQNKGLKIGLCEVFIEHLGYSKNPKEKFKRDLQLVTKELNRNPKNLINWHRLALIYYHLEKREIAKSVNAKALTMIREKGDYSPEEVVPFHLEAHMKLDFGEDVYPILFEGLQYYPADPLLNYLLAKTFIRDGKYTEAIPLCIFLIERGRKQDFDRSISHPERIFNEYAFDTLATCYFKLGEFSKAIKQYEKAFECSQEQEYRLKKELCKKLHSRK